MTRFWKTWRKAALAGWLLVPVTFAEISPSTALEAYRRGNYRGSQAQYGELAKEEPQDARLRFNAGAAAYRQNDLTNATAWFESVLGAPDLRLQQQAYYNLGNTQFRLGEALPEPQVRKQLWGQALTNFGSALKLDGADTNAAANFAFVRQKLQELEEQTPPPQQQQKQDQKDQQDQQDSSQDQQQQPDNSAEQDQKSDPSQQPQQSDNSDSSRPDPPDPSGRQPPESDNASGDQQEPSGGQQDQPGDSSDSAGQKPQDGDQPGTSGEGSQGEGQEAAGAGEPVNGEMSAAQAVQMLESQKGEEKALLLRTYGSGKEAAERAARIRKPW